MRTLTLLVVALLVACGADPSADAGPVCDPGWTCPDCRNYVRFEGVCYRMDPQACGPMRRVCRAGEVCDLVTERRFDHDAGENVTTRYVGCRAQ